MLLYTNSMLVQYILIYINDLQDRVTSLSRLFADDTILHHLITCMQEPVVLQEDLHKLEA